MLEGLAREKNSFPEMTDLLGTRWIPSLSLPLSLSLSF
jgi:hypothetical protein